MPETLRENVSPEELARFNKLAARWWGEAGAVAGCLWHAAPASARPWTAGLARCTMDGSKPVGSVMDA